MTSQGSAGNVLAAIASFFIPGLGQLTQGRLFKAFLHFIVATAVWAISFGTMGWIVHLWSTYSAAVYEPQTHTV